MVMPQTQRIVKRKDTNPKSMRIPKGSRSTSTCTPLQISTRAATASKASFTGGLMSMRSSTRPVKNMTLPPARIPNTARSARTNTAAQIMNAR